MFEPVIPGQYRDNVRDLDERLAKTIASGENDSGRVKLLYTLLRITSPPSSSLALRRHEKTYTFK